MTVAEIRDIPGGSRGTLDTLKLMRALVAKSKRSFPMRKFAADMVAGLSQKNYSGEAKILHAFVRDKIRYVKDIRGIETVQSPEKTLEFGYGDCDDKSTLIATLLEVIGHPTRFVALGFSKDKFSHVYVEMKMGKKWIGVETTEPVELGWYPPGIISRMVVNN